MSVFFFLSCQALLKHDILYPVFPIESLLFGSLLVAISYVQVHIASLAHFVLLSSLHFWFQN